MKSVCDAVNNVSSDWSATQTFTTKPLRIGDEVESASQVSGRLIVYPNPTEGLLKVTFQIEDILTTIARIELFEAAGRNIYSSSSTIESGLLELGLDVGSLPQGFYFLNVTVAGIAYRETFIVQ